MDFLCDKCGSNDYPHQCYIDISDLRNDDSSQKLTNERDTYQNDREMKNQKPSTSHSCDNCKSTFKHHRQKF